MRFRQVLAVSAVVVVAGCSSAAATSKKPVAMPSDPVAAITAAKARMGKESARFAQDAGYAQINYTGVVDARTGNWEITGQNYVVRRVGSDLYVKASAKILEVMMASAAATDRMATGGWARTRLPNFHQDTVTFNDDFPWDLADVASRATGMTRTGDHSFAGSYAVQKKATRVGVDLDDQGRLNKITLGEPADPTVVYTFSDFGLRTDITAPPEADVTDEDNPQFLVGTGLQ